MSYKFQRLREKIRQAVASGELSGKLPGERELARRFHVNAKTLSKALTDLAAEGLLQRSIGRGTFVKGSTSEPESKTGPWLLLCDADEADSPVVRQLLAANPASHVAHDVGPMRPSFLNQFAAVIDLSARTPEPFLRDLVVRNIPLLAVGHAPRPYSTNAVLIDKTLAASELGRNLMLQGHRRLVAVEGRNHTAVTEALRLAATRYAPEATVDTCFAREVPFAVEQGATAIVCDSAASAREAVAALQGAGVEIPAKASVAAIGCCAGDHPCTGYYVTPDQQAAAIVDLLKNATAGRPTTLWLAGTLIDRGTTAVTAGPLDPAEPLDAGFPALAV